jgi:hypothetical protein
MKFTKSAVAALFALASVMGASATTNVIHIVGSTAYRAPVNDAIQRILAPGYSYCNTSGTTNTSIAGASTSLYVGTIASGLPGAGSSIEIKTAFSGSISGLADMAQGVVVKFIPDGNATNPGSKYTGSVSDAEVADFAWTDTDAGTDKLIVKNAVSSAAYNAIANKTFDEAGTQGESSEGQGLVFFELVEEALVSGSATPFTNITTDNLATLITQGYISLAALSGTDTPTNEATDIVLTGRSEDSGSRGNVFACAFEGATSSIGSLSQVQYQGAFSPSPLATGTVATYTDAGAADAGLSTTVAVGGTSSYLTAMNEWPAGWGLNSDTTIYWSPAGHSGYNAGGNVATSLSATDGITNVSFTDGVGNPASAVYVVGYLGGNDAATCVSVTGGTTGNLVATGGTNAYNSSGARAVRIAYNGVQYSQAAVLNGSYGLWGYEHAYYIQGSTAYNNSVDKDAMDDIADKVYGVTAQDDVTLTNSSTDAAAGIFIPGGSGSGNSGGTEEVERGGPGQPITTENDY